MTVLLVIRAGPPTRGQAYTATASNLLDVSDADDAMNHGLIPFKG